MRLNKPSVPHPSILKFIQEKYTVIPELGEVYNSKGNKVQTLHNSGYLVGCVLGKQILLHHIIWFVHFGKWPEEQLDHEDKNKLNNRIDNLREVTHSQQMVNRDFGREGMKGIQRVENRYEVRVSIEGKHRYIGAFKKLEDAQEAFKNARGV